MIKIRGESVMPYSHARRGKAELSETISIDVFGESKDRYRFALEVQRCAAAFAALKLFPCAGEVCIDIRHGLAEVSGEIAYFAEDAASVARLAKAQIEAMANVAAASSLSSAAAVRLGQKWSWDA